MASSGIQTPLTQEYPAIATMSRQEIESLLAGYNPNRSDPPWYLQQATPTMPAEETGFEAFIESQPQIQQLRQESQRLLKQNEEKASRNMTMQPGLEALRNETQQLYDRARKYEQEWPLLDNQMKEAYKRFSPSTLLFTLTQSAGKLHDQSESLASAFAEGLPLESGAATPTGRDADGDATFVRRYRALRTTYHRRNLMADRWARGTITWRDD
ncbi:uncharacterized protein FA14DRAFT_131721 [Meira miltonrushii]|uniref:VPS37 C-terminal domain-containing protein n=1 Tax=Meira miltonrushii TaxID=1280837 RepID=A0A316VM28_9BASI|nr:uncharacterized protein FA14DRAFT_131721 [Meira miltonrushii]PWN38370.1 hypothetical protein FA14DRAFT_131721 [Meira miltonrushii]